jgi:hypothetical protein
VIRMFETKCKICGGRAIARWDEHAPQEAVDGWIPMLTCDPCYDLRVKRNESAGAIFNACFRFQHTANPQKVKGEIRGALMLSTRAYAEVMQREFKAPEIIWSEGFVDCLLDAPAKCAEILRDYRAEVRRSARRQEVAA